MSEHSPRPELDESRKLEALRAPAGCGRSLPGLHLADLDEVFTQRRRHRTPIVLCCADVADPDDMADRDDDGRDCPGCVDCLRYCPDCVREAVEWSARRDGAGAGGGG